MPSSSVSHVLVVGAGPAGLFAAKTLTEAGFQVTVAEQTDRVGGLTASQLINGNHYEFGVHHFHAFDPFVFGEISRLMGERLRSVEKSALIRYGKGFCRYPLEFSDILMAMPPVTLARCCLGLAVQQLRNRLRPADPADGEQALIQLYGAPLYQAFFRDFTHRYWGLPPAELSAVFIQKKMPRLSAFDAMHKLLAAAGAGGRRQGSERPLESETLYYSEIGAHALCETLLDHVRRRGATVHFDAPLTRIEMEESGVARATLGTGARRVVHRVDFCISTAPIPSLIRAFGERAAVGTRAAAEALQYKPQSVVGLLVKRERVLGALYVYFRDRVFHRIGEPKLSGLRVHPADHTILVVELTDEVRPGDTDAERRVMQEICRDLQRDALIAGPADIAEYHFLHRRYAYPILRKGFEQPIATVSAFLRQFPTVLSTGRQGGFSYPNMHEAMRMGHEAARAAIAHLSKVGHAEPAASTGVSEARAAVVAGNER